MTSNIQLLKKTCSTVTLQSYALHFYLQNLQSPVASAMIFSTIASLVSVTKDVCFNRIEYEYIYRDKKPLMFVYRF